MVHWRNFMSIIRATLALAQPGRRLFHSRTRRTKVERPKPIDETPKK